VYVDPGAAAVPPPVPPGGAAQGVNPPPASPPTPVRLTDADVLLNILVPPEAAVWVNGQPTRQLGPRREYMSSGLAPGRTYTYTVRARWTAPGGSIVDQERRITVQGGERRTVDFLTAPANPPGELPIVPR
jgi:uncharacterized protein (TIGR03000 family)